MHQVSMLNIWNDAQVAAQSAAFHASDVHEECKQASSTHGVHKVSMGIIQIDAQVATTSAALQASNVHEVCKQAVVTR